MNCSRLIGLAWLGTEIDGMTWKRVSGEAQHQASGTLELSDFLLTLCNVLVSFEFSLPVLSINLMIRVACFEPV